MFVTPIPIRRHKRLLGRFIRRREHRLAIYACVLSFFLTFLVGVERYQAQEIRTFIAQTELRQGTSAWLVALASMRRVAREERWQIVAKRELPPPAVDLGALSDHPSAFAAALATTAVRPGRTQVNRSAAPSVSREQNFPAFGYASFPVSRVPDWGAMRSAAEWDRTYGQIPQSETVPLPRYNLAILTIPLMTLTNPIRSESIPTLTAKLAYSTRYYGAYDLDAGEFSGLHPGIDLKLAFGTPVGAVAGGRVRTIGRDDSGLGLFAIVQHRLETGERLFSVYGHLDTAWVQEGDDVRPSQTIGTVGLSGRTTAPHLHLQIDRDDGSVPHRPFSPASIPSAAEANRHTVNPITFIRQYAQNPSPFGDEREG